MRMGHGSGSVAVVVDAAVDRAAAEGSAVGKCADSADALGWWRQCWKDKEGSSVNFSFEITISSNRPVTLT